jgi:hypothetical protein
MPFMIRKSPPALTPGCYPAQIADVKVVEGQYGPRLTWSIEMTHNGHVYKAMGYTDTTFYTGSREHQWASAILGMDLQPDEEFGESELIGAPVLARISCKPGRNGMTFYTIEDLIVPKASEDNERPGAEAAQNPEDDVAFPTPPASDTTTEDKVPF